MADREVQCDETVADSVLLLAWRMAVCLFYLFITAEVHEIGVSVLATQEADTGKI